ncbi:MAG TPA: hypothetical protein VFK13_04535 [Gemmatimonadaceae bacterium]|nr:hypothetical protein [Gemmatimonadaceae bacterium]
MTLELQRRQREETRQRFFEAIAAQLPVERVVEMHLFAPLRQGGVESGVAVLALAADAHAAANDDACAVEQDAEVLATDSPDAPENAGASVGADDAASTAADDDASAPAPAGSAPPHQPARLTIYTARYRLVLKGADRGTWDAEVVLEAHAPLAVVDDVVLGVQRRAGDATPAERLSGVDLRAALHHADAAGDAWTPTP